MPSLTWPSKSSPQPIPSGLKSESSLHPYPGYRDPDPGSRLILGDNLRVMWALLEEWEGEIDLIYADPPFFTNKGYPARVGRGEDSRQPQEWELAAGYQDNWEDLDHYLQMLYDRLSLMYRLLSPTGSLYLHLDWHANAYARILLDEIFGYDRLNNEIVWTYHGPSPIRSAFNRKHDTILFYTKGEEYTFNVDQVRMPYSSSTVETFNSSKKAGFGKTPNLKRGKVPEDWWYFPVVARLHSERTGYPTQKPESLLERIILASSDPGDLVADFFAGSGTTAVVAARLGRRFVAVDAQARAIQTMKSRLVLDAVTEQEPEKQGAPLSVLIQRERGVKPQKYAALADPELPVYAPERRTLTLPEDLIGELDYWEVDPDWRGGVFQSCWQGARPWRKGEIPSRLTLPEVGQQIGVRLVMINGDQYQAVISP